MRSVIQRVASATLKIEGKEIATIENGLLVYLGITNGDSEKTVDYTLNKLVNMRIFEDENGKLNKSILDMGYNILLVSNFTLYGNALSGRRPDFTASAKYDIAAPLFEYAKSKLLEHLPPAQFGVFGADMQIESVAVGPVNIILEC